MGEAPAVRPRCRDLFGWRDVMVEKDQSGAGGRWKIGDRRWEMADGNRQQKSEIRSQKSEGGSRPEIDWYFGTRKKKYHDCNSL